MALNRHLYPPGGTNIVDLKQYFSNVTVDTSAQTFTTVAGYGVTVTKIATGTYQVAFDNSGTVTYVVDADVRCITGATYDATKVVSCRIKSLSTTGFVFETFAPSGATVADLNVNGSTLILAVTAQNSAVKA